MIETLKQIRDSHPRPRLVRMSYQILDGLWNFQISPESTPLSSLNTTIQVPYAPETIASTVYKTINPEDYLHYSLNLDINKDANKRIRLNFQAVDQECWVYVNNKYIGNHQGGYTSFSFDITECLSDGKNELYIIAHDKTELAPYGRGKQRLHNTGPMASIFYTPVSGIWQSVWLEWVPDDFIEALSIEADFDNQSINIDAKTVTGLKESYEVSLYQNDHLIATHTLKTNTLNRLNLEAIEPWSPSNPNLYDVLISYKDDIILSYTGFRSIKAYRDASNYNRFALNDQPIFMSGVLDQGYWHSTLLTPPSINALKDDILLMKSMGFNTLRKHVKIESEQFYYLCDRIGMLVWQDIPNGGADYNFKLVTYLPNISDWLSRHISDSNYKRMGRNSKESRAIYYQELEATIQQLKHYPSIVVWVPFNEGWGQFDAPVATQKIRNLDSSRLINEACGWFDQGGGDIYSIHSYFKPIFLTKQERIICLSEFGGHALAIKDHTFGTKNFGYKTMNAKTAPQAYQKLYDRKVIRFISKGMSSSIMTQLSDVYSEVNGLITFDRKVTKVDPNILITINQSIYEEFDRCINIKK